MPSRLAVVTGGSRGLGRELALALAREGYDLLVCTRGARDLESVRNEILSLGLQCRTWQGDLTDPVMLNAGGSFQPSLMYILRSSPVEVLVNNAGCTHPLKPMWELNEQDFWQAMKLNLHVPFRLMQAVVPGMKARGSGTLVNICSLSGRRAIRNASAYSASKFALRGMTESVAQELEGTGARCFSVSPGGMATSMRLELFGDAAQQQDPTAVAQIIVDAIAGRIAVGQGEDLVVRQGQYTIVPREQWTGIMMKHDQAVAV